MEELQMEYVIKKIRENEEKTQELTTVLEGFHQSFDRLIGNIERVLEVGTIDQATKSVRQLDTHLGRIEKQLYTHHEEGKAMLEQMSGQLENGHVHRAMPERVGQVGEKVFQSSSRTLIQGNRLYVIDEKRTTIYVYNLKNGEKDVYHVHDQKIDSIGICGDAVYIYDEDHKIYKTSHMPEPLLEDVVMYALSYYGIVYKNAMGNLKLYKFDGNQKSLGKRIGYFEVVDGRYVLLENSKEGQQLIDLKVMNVDQPLCIK